MQTKVQRKGGTSFRNNGYLRELGRIVRASPVELCEDQRHCYIYAQQRHMDHATRKSSCLHLSHNPRRQLFLDFLSAQHQYNASHSGSLLQYQCKSSYGCHFYIWCKIILLSKNHCVQPLWLNVLKLFY